MRASLISARGGTPPDLIDAAGLGARIATRSFRAKGLDDKMIRRHVIARFGRIVECDFHDEYERETLMAVVQRAVEEVLEDPGPRPAPGAPSRIEREGWII